MSEKEIDPKNSGDTMKRLKDGEEPTELLLSLVSSPLIDLKGRGEALVYTAKDEAGTPVVLAIFRGVTWDESSGLLPVELPTLEESGVLAVPASVGSPAGVLAVSKEET